MCGGVGTASQSTTDSLSMVCQNVQSYILRYFTLVVIANCNIFSVLLSAEVEDGEELLKHSTHANCNIFSVLLAAEVEDGEELLKHSTDALRQVCTNTEPEYN